MRDYPRLPGVFDVPKHSISAWSHAQTHIWLVWIYADGLESYIHPPQLTTGPRCTCTAYSQDAGGGYHETLAEPDPECPMHFPSDGCACRDAPGWYPGRPDNPNCPAHGHQKPATPPCNCWYVVAQVRDAPGPYAALLDLYGIGKRWGTRCFLINPKCPHHGEAASEDDQFDAHYPDGGVWGFSYEDTLDEDERRGN